MIDKAIAKITEEMMKLDDPLAMGIEEHLTEICKNDYVAGKLLDPAKSLKGACEHITAQGEKTGKERESLHIRRRCLPHGR